jgi:hypothetical protein
LQHQVLDLEALLRLRLGRCKCLIEPIAQHAELQRVEDLVHFFAIPGVPDQVVELDGNGYVADELVHLAIDQHLRKMFPQRITRLALRLIGMGNELGQ